MVGRIFTYHKIMPTASYMLVSRFYGSRCNCMPSSSPSGTYLLKTILVLKLCTNMYFCDGPTSTEWSGLFVCWARRQNGLAYRDVVW